MLIRLKTVTVLGSVLSSLNSKLKSSVLTMFLFLCDMQRSKPNLAMTYISKCDLIVYDLHSGNPEDVKLALGAMNKKRPDDGDT